MAGEQPQICPACQKSAHWTSVEGAGPIDRRKHSKRPRVPYDVTIQDRKLFLKRIGVSPE